MTNFDNESKFFLQMQQGNRRAFEYFFKTYVDMLYAYALGYCRDSDAAGPRTSETHPSRFDLCLSHTGYVLKRIPLG